MGEKGYNKNDNQIRRKERQNANTRTDEFRQLQEESRRMPETELQAYHSGERTIDEALRGRLSGIFERQLGSFFGRNGDGVQLLTLDSKKGSYKIYSNIDGTLFHDCFEIARCYLENGELVDLHDNYDDATCYLSGDGLSGFAITDTGDLISVFNVSGKDTFRPDVLSIRRMRRPMETGRPRYINNLLKRETLMAIRDGAMMSQEEKDRDAEIAARMREYTLATLRRGEELDKKKSRELLEWAKAKKLKAQRESKS